MNNCCTWLTTWIKYHTNTRKKSTEKDNNPNFYTLFKKDSFNTPKCLSNPKETSCQ